MGEEKKIVEVFKNHVSWLIPIFLTLATAIGYFITYKSEEGFCYQFGIPTYLIQLSISSILFWITKLIIYIVVTFVIWFIYHEIVYINFGKTSDFWKFPLSVLGFCLFSCIFYILLSWGVWAEWNWLFFMLIFAFVISIVPSIIAKCRSKKDKKHTDLKSGLVEKPANATTNNSKTTISYLKILAFTAIFIMFINSISSSLGEAQAKHQTEYFTISKPQYFAVLRIYGDDLVCKPLNIPNNSTNSSYELSGNLTLFQLNDNTELILTNTGVLKND
jgi:hypothetical protein